MSSDEELLALAAENVADLADRTAQYGLHLYLEPLSWAPINGLKKSLRLIHMAGRPNVKEHHDSIAGFGFSPSPGGPR
jgi:hypothetical protein